MRASDLLTGFSVDLGYLEIDEVKVENAGSLEFIKEIRLIDQGLLIISASTEEMLPIKELLVTLMLHKQCKLYKGTEDKLVSVYGYKIQGEAIIL